MNARQLASLFFFNLRLIPSSTWMILGMLSFQPIALQFIFFRWAGLPEESSLSGQVTYLTILFPMLMGLQLFFASGMGPTASLPSAAEFLWVRPIPRRTVYFCRVFLYFLMMLILPVAKVGLTVPDPDLRLSLYHSKSYHTEAAEKLPLYQAQFPASSIVRLPGSSYDTLVIPFGATLIALWQLGIVLLLAPVLQVVTLKPLPQNIQVGVFVGLGSLLCLVIGSSLFPEPKEFMEKTFFLFVHYWILVSLATLGVFFLIQRLAWKRVQDLEMN